MKQEEHKIIFDNGSVKTVIIKSFGWNSPENEWFCQEEEEVVYLSKGSAVIQFENAIIKLKEGDSYVIKPRRKHRVSFTSGDCEWVCVYLPKANKQVTGNR